MRVSNQKSITFGKEESKMTEQFYGHRLHKIDNKGRISVPAYMRTQLGTEFMATRGIGKCLALFPLEEWNIFMENIRTKVKQKQRKALEFYFTAYAEKMSLDGQGRILLNETLRRHVELSDQGEAIVFGNNNRVEIWNCDLFYEQLNGITPDEVEDIIDEYDL